MALFHQFIDSITFISLLYIHLFIADVFVGVDSLIYLILFSFPLIFV